MSFVERRASLRRTLFARSVCGIFRRALSPRVLSPSPSSYLHLTHPPPCVLHLFGMICFHIELLFGRQNLPCCDRHSLRFVFIFVFIFIFIFVFIFTSLALLPLICVSGASLTWFYSNGTAPQSPAALALKLIDTELDSAVYSFSFSFSLAITFAFSLPKLMPP